MITAMKKAPAKPAKAPEHRRDATGHLDPKYAADLLAMSRAGADPKDQGAFLHGVARSQDALAEQLGEAFVSTATSGEDVEEDILNEEVTEEVGGPFVETSGKTEFARGTDASNPGEATREPFPTS